MSPCHSSFRIVENYRTWNWRLDKDKCPINPGYDMMVGQGGVMSIATVLRLGQRRIRPSTGREKRVFPSPEDGSGAHSAFYSMGTGDSFLGVKRLGRESGHSSPSSADVQNDWSYTSSLSIYLHGVYRDNFTFFAVLMCTKWTWRSRHHRNVDIQGEYFVVWRGFQFGQ
jgi:hypothetical protein